MDLGQKWMPTGGNGNHSDPLRVAWAGAGLGQDPGWDGGTRRIWSLEHRTWSWAGFAQPGDEAARRKTLVLSATWWEDLGKARLFSGVCLGRTRKTRSKLEHGKFQLSIRKIFPQERSSTAPGAQRGWGILEYPGTFKPQLRSQM